MLKKAHMIVKVCSCLDHDLSAYIFLRVEEDAGESCALVEKNLDIFLGSKSFWGINDKLTESDKDIVSVAELSQELADDLK